MEPVIRQFRTALGGFNRRDVQQYIEQISAAHRQETAELRSRLEDEERRRVELEEAMTGLESERGAAAAEGARVREHLEESTRTLTRLRGEQCEAEIRLAEAKKELDRLRTRVAELAPMAESYAQLKDRVATVELEAHRKAESIVSEARTEAAALREETGRWLEAVLAQYGAVRRGMDTLLEQARELAGASEQTAALEEQAKALREQGGLEA